jgi:hypothetical protein
MKTSYLIFILLVLIVSGCSVLENTFCLKNTKKNDGWNRMPDNQYVSYYSFYSNLYAQINNMDTISVGVSSNSRMLFLGPPLLPFFPVFYTKGFNDGIYLTLNIRSNKYDDIDNLLKYTRFTLNDSLNLIPEKKYLWKDGDYIECQDCTLQTQRTRKNENVYIENPFAHKSIRVGLHFNINSRNVRKLLIVFDDKLSNQLELRVKSLELKRKYHLHYTPFIYMAH